MCNFENGFILCTCEAEKPIIHNKHSRRHKRKQKENADIYCWFLSSFKEQFESIMEGLYELPAKNIGEGLTEEWVLLNLNVGNCFDFAYIPQEGDNLVIKSMAKPYVYLSFIFQEGEWRSGHYNVFNHILELKLKGELKQIPEQ